MIAFNLFGPTTMTALNNQAYGTAGKVRCCCHGWGTVNVELRESPLLE